MRIIIAGSRDIHEYYGHELYVMLYRHFPNFKSIVCGMAKGVDKAGYDMALERDIPVHEFPAEWQTYGKAAGIIRNQAMADFADGLLAIWNGKSRGTKNMIEEMLKRDKPIHVELYL